ncbi:MAG: ADP-ribosyltransferase [Elusimicrobiota bacterium]|nr:ADP-ribosyltransferase [Elusimicrobiota bacterium]
MKTYKGILKGGLAAVLASLLVNTAKAADLSFDGASGGLSLLEAVNSAENRADLPRLSIVPSAVGAHAYDFRTLYEALGYPSPDYFGSSEEEVQDLEAYTDKDDTFYSEINGYLRYYPAPYDWYGTGPGEAKAIVGRIDRIFKRAPALPADLILFRGLGLGHRADKPFALGEEFVDKGYISTSLSYGVARFFAVEMDEDKPSRRALFAIYLARPGEKGILVDQGEDEVILKHGRRFRVMAQKAGVKAYDLYLVQACSGPCETLLKNDVNDFWSALNVQD